MAGMFVRLTSVVSINKILTQKTIGFLDLQTINKPQARQGNDQSPTEYLTDVRKKHFVRQKEKQIPK